MTFFGFLCDWLSTFSIYNISCSERLETNGVVIEVGLLELDSNSSLFLLCLLKFNGGNSSGLPKRFFTIEFAIEDDWSDSFWLKFVSLLSCSFSDSWTSFIFSFSLSGLSKLREETTSWDIFWGGLGTFFGEQDCLYFGLKIRQKP